VARVTLQTIADRVGVSRMTVSNAFSRPDQLSSQLRDQILAAAAELGYSGPDPAARALARGTVGTVGVVLTDSLDYAFTDEIATRMLAAMSAELARTGRGLTLLTTIERDGFVPARDIPMDGAIVFACHSPSAPIHWLEQRKLPLVFVDQAPQTRHPSVNIDERGGARAGAQHLVDLRHRRIAFATNVEGQPSGRIDRDAAMLTPDFTVGHRLLGWLDVLDAAGIEPIIVNSARSTEDDGATIAAEIGRIPARRRPTAVLAYSDRVAAGIVFGAQRLGLDVPGDLSVVGFDGATFAASMRPALTTVVQDVDAKGRAAAIALNDALDPRTSDRPRTHVVLDTQLVVRESTARARSPRAVSA
jgi:DNA-binding LacI/PurR family transcriptional regulator